MKNIENLDSLFNVDSMEESENPNLEFPVIMNPNKEMDQEDDYQLARKTLRNLIVKGDSTLNALIDLSKNSETPRHYEVAGQFIKTLSDVSKDLLNLQKQMKEIEEEKTPQNIGTQNNVVFAGSTNELMQLLGKPNNDKIIDQ